MSSIIGKIRRTVLSKMMLRSIIVLSLSILLVEFLAYRQASKQIVQLTEERQLELTALYAERFDQIVEAVEIDLRSVAGLPSLRDYFVNRQYDLQAEASQQLDNVTEFLLRLYERNRAYSKIELSARNGEKPLTVHKGDAFRHKIEPIDYFGPELTPQEKTNLSAGFVDEGVRQGQGDDGDTLLYSYGLSVQGEPVGRVFISYDFGELTQDLRSQKLFETGHLAIFTQDGEIVYAPGLQTGDRLETVRPGLWRRLAEMTLPGTGQFENAMDRGFLVSATAMRAKPWIIAAIAPEREMFADLNRSRNVITGLVIIAILLELLAVYWFTDHLITRPVNRLLDGTRAVHSGKLDHTVMIDSNDEFGELAGSFNHMTRSLKDSISELERENERRAKAEEELRHAHDGLEQRVAERTKDLEAEIARRAAAQKALRKSEEKFRDYTAVSSDWVWETGPDFKVTYISERAFDALGVPAEEIIGREANEGVDTGYKHEEWEVFRQLIRERRKFKEFQYRYNHPDGRIRYIRVSGKPIFDEKGAFAGYRGTGTDVTEAMKTQEEIRKAKTEAEHANEAKSEFLAKMSHELRTPLNAVIGYADVMREGIFGSIENERYQEYLTHIHGSGTHLLGLIDEILDLSKIEAGHVELQPETFELSRFVENTLTTVTPMAKARMNNLSMICPKNIGDIHADKSRLNQILLNLLSNACKFTEEGDVTLTVETENDGREVVFAVCDTGIGIPENKMSDLFEEFTQVHPEMVRSYGGTGLGLSISKSLCEMMGGSISVESLPDQGSTFTIRMPRGEV